MSKHMEVKHYAFDQTRAERSKLDGIKKLGSPLIV